MEIKIWSVIHTEAGIVHSCNSFGERPRAVNHRDWLFDHLVEQDKSLEGMSIDDYNKGEATLQVVESQLEVCNAVVERLEHGRDSLCEFIRQYFSRSDIDVLIGGLTGFGEETNSIPLPTGLSNQGLVDFLSAVTGIMINVSNLRGILETAALPDVPF